MQQESYRNREGQPLHERAGFGKNPGENHTQLFLERIGNDHAITQLAGLYYRHLQTSRYPYRAFLDMPVSGSPENARFEVSHGSMDDVKNSADQIPLGSYLVSGRTEDSLKAFLNQPQDVCIAALASELIILLAHTSSLTMFEPASRISVGFRGELNRWTGLSGSGEIGIVRTCKEIFREYSNDPIILNVIERSIIEAHEKGHGLRSFNIDSAVTDEILACIEPNKFRVPSDRLDLIRARAAKNSPIMAWLSRVGVRSESVQKELKWYKEYYTDCNEVIERMSQLKNYFGLNYGEQFTKEHLEYARKHYGQDYGKREGVDMESFLIMVTEKTIDNFISVMNTYPL